MGNRVDTACKSSLMPQIVFPLSSPSRVFKRHNVYCVETEVRLVRNSVLFASFMLHRCAPLAARSKRLGWGFFVFVLPRRPDDSLTCTTSEYWWPQSLSFTPSLFFFVTATLLRLFSGTPFKIQFGVNHRTLVSVLQKGGAKWLRVALGEPLINVNGL